jgi:hypothetical protein
MVRTRLNAAALLLGCSLLAPSGLGAAELVSAASQLSGAKSAEEMHTIVLNAYEERTRVAWSLSEVFASPASTAAKAGACFLLGRFHGGRSVDAMIAHVDLQWEGGVRRGWGKYPCEAALLKQEHETDRLILVFLAQSDDGAKREHLVSVLLRWFGQEATAAKLRQAAAENEGQSARRLAEALRAVEAHGKKLGQ